MLKNKTLAIIGLGGQTQSELLPALKALDNTGTTWVLCDLKKEFIDEAKQYLPVGVTCKTYSRYGDLFRSIGAELDAVFACVPHFLYGDIVTRALTLGVPVFKEKPLAHDYGEARKISNLALRKSIQVYTATKRQFYPSYQAALQTLRSGQIGRPYMYSARHFISHGNLYQGWRSTIEAAGGGVFLDMGYHLLDILVRYFGDISQINMHWSNVAKTDFSYEVEDAASLHIWHPAGVHGVFQLAALSGPKEEQIEIRGTLGRLIVTKDRVETFDVNGRMIEGNDYKANGVKATIVALKEFFSDDKNIWVQNLSHNVRLMRVFHQVYKVMLKHE